MNEVFIRPLSRLVDRDEGRSHLRSHDTGKFDSILLTLPGPTPAVARKDMH